MQSAGARVIPIGRSPMIMTNYIKLARYSQPYPEARQLVTSQVFPFNSGSAVSRVKALQALHAAMAEPIPEGTQMRCSVWRYQPGYSYPVIGDLEAAS